MKKIIISGLVCILFIQVFAAENVLVTAGDTAKKVKVIILPFANNTDQKKYKNSELIRFIFFKSFYSFIGVIPSLDVPDASVLTNISLGAMPIQQLAENQGADLIIYGNYYLEGDRTEPNAVCYLKIWDNSKKTNMINVKYKSPTSADIFDTIDEMIAKALKSSLNIDPDTATIIFENFNTGKEQFGLYVNNKLIDSITNTGYSYNLKILPKTDYSVQLRRKYDNSEAFQGLVNLQKYKTISISYNAYGKVTINPIGYKDNLKTYSLFFNDKPAVEGQMFSNLQAGVNYNVVVKDNQQNIVSREDFYLRDAENKVISPSEKNYFPFHIKAYSLDRNFLTLGVDFFPWRYFWFGLGAGGSFTSTTNGSIYFISPHVEAGYYLLGDMAYDFRVGLGLIGKVNMFLPEDVAKSANKDAVNYSPNVGLFVQLEWKFIVLRPTAYLVIDGQNLSFTYGAGVGLRL